MDSVFSSDAADGHKRRIRPHYRPGDLVTSVTGYPILYEVLGVEQGGLLRVRGNNWAPGYTAMVSLSEVRPATQILMA